MSGSNTCLAVNFFERRLFYAVSELTERRKLVRLGSHEYTFSIADAFRANEGRKLDGIYSVVKNLKAEYDPKMLYVTTFPVHECWSILPKLAQDQPEEREAYLGILMRGVKRQHVETTWHELSNRDYRMLALRDRRIMAGFDRFGEIVSATDFISDFEIGSKWSGNPSSGGSYLTICAHAGYLSVSSYLLGKLRGTTGIRFDAYDDLSYLWALNAQHLRWMKGIHEQVLIYGHRSAMVSDVLRSVMDSASDVLVMDSLAAMGASASEETYNFDLSQAFPAVMLATTAK
jgi:hypothetical protein